MILEALGGSSELNKEGEENKITAVLAHSNFASLIITIEVIFPWNIVVVVVFSFFFQHFFFLYNNIM